MKVRRRRLGQVAMASRLRYGLVVATCIAVTACGAEPTEFPPTEPTPVRLEYDPIVLASQDDALMLIAAGPDSTEPVQFGTSELNLDVSTVSSGTIEAHPGPGAHDAFRFPRYTNADQYPRAVVTVTNVEEGLDVLNPGERPFTWGAVFMLDKTSVGRPEDNGDNLVQRGLFSEDALYKAEVDEHRAACTVKGTKGVLTVRTPERLRSNVWYVVECEREGTRLRVQAWELDKQALPMSTSVFGEMGTVRMSSPAIPISIGGKVAPNGQLVQSDSDQFNGVLAEAFLQIAGAT